MFYKYVVFCNRLMIMEVLLVINNMTMYFWFLYRNMSFVDMGWCDCKQSIGFGGIQQPSMPPHH